MNKLNLTCLLTLCLSGAALAGGVELNQSVTLLFFDRAGHALDLKAMRAVSNNGQAGYDNDALLNPQTLEVVAQGVLPQSGAARFALPAQPVAFALNWPTTRGYSLLILDNGSAGFKKSATVNFTYQAALDTQRRLNAALQARPDYWPSDTFKTAYDKAAKLLTQASAANQATRGKSGYLALDQLAVAYDALLTEYGPLYAARNQAKLRPWLGVTIDTTGDYQANLDLAAKLTQPYGWIRVVFDAGRGPADYAALIAYAKAKGLKVLGQPVDSSYDPEYTPELYRQRFTKYLTYYDGVKHPALDAWELGNEVNGSWLSDTVPQKIALAAREVRRLQPQAKTVLTLFWQINTDSRQYAMFNWARSNLPASVRADLDVVFFSQYAEQAPMGLAFDQVMEQMAREFPNQQIGVGELGYWIPEQRFWWAFDERDPLGKGIRGTAAQYFPASFAYPNSVGGVFWWNFIGEFKKDPRLQSTLSGLRDQFQSAEQK